MPQKNKDVQDTGGDELVRKKRKNSLLERVQSLVKSTLPKYTKIQLEPGEEWDFEEKQQKLSYVLDLDKQTDRDFISESLHNIGNVKYTDRNVGAKMKPSELPTPASKFIHMTNTLEDIRTEEKMMRSFPGTYDNFLYRHMRSDSMISNAAEQSLPKNLQFIYSLEKAYWGDPLDNLYPEVQVALETCEEALIAATKAKSFAEVIEITKNMIWPIYQKLLEDDQEVEKKGGQRGGQIKKWEEWSKKGIDPTEMQEMLKEMSKEDYEKAKEEQKKKEQEQKE